jgi:hypothetical protein
MINKGEDIMSKHLLSINDLKKGKEVTLKKVIKKPKIIDRSIVGSSFRAFNKITSYNHVEQYKALKELIKDGQEQLELLKDIMLENNLAYREAASTSRRMMKREEAIKVLGVETVDKITKTINVQGKFVVGKRPRK